MTVKKKDAHAEPEAVYALGAGIYDITGPCAEVGLWGYAKPGQYAAGIHMRLRSRAFAFHHKASDEHFVFVSVDVGSIPESVTHAVLERLASSEKIPSHVYKASNVLLSAVHTHCSPGGLCSYLMYNLHPPLKGFDPQNFECVVNGITESIQRAYHNLQDGYIRVAKGLCLGASVNRSSEAYMANPAEERALYEHDTDKEMVLWRLDGVNGFPIGMINWFAVHPTSMGSWYTLITGDNKGLASHWFEKDMGTNHLRDKPRSFVAAFAQTNEGDVSPNVWGPREMAGDLSGDHERMRIIALKQYETAKELYATALQNAPMTGLLCLAHQYVDYGSIELEEPYHEYKDCPPRTCEGCIGLSMLSGTGFDGRGLSFLREGIKWGDYPRHLQNFTFLPQLQREQMEKPVILPSSKWGMTPHVLPLQLVLVGDTALAALPFEVTTMAGRRLRKSILQSLEGMGIASVVIAGLSNAYSGYMTTREEFSVQRYEGASTHFGPNQLSATKQQFHLLATALRTQRPVSTLPPPESKKQGFTNFNTSVIHDGAPYGVKFGDVLKGKDVCKSYRVGETVSVQFQSGHPKNNLRIQGSFLEVHRLHEGKFWVMHCDDGDENTRYTWNRSRIDQSIVTIEWDIPEDTLPGTYKIKHNGNYTEAWRKKVASFHGESSSFTIHPREDGNNDTTTLSEEEKPEVEGE